MGTFVFIARTLSWGFGICLAGVGIWESLLELSGGAQLFFAIFGGIFVVTTTFVLYVDVLKFIAGHNAKQGSSFNRS